MRRSDVPLSVPSQFAENVRGRRALSRQIQPYNALIAALEKRGMGKLLD